MVEIEEVGPEALERVNRIYAEISFVPSELPRDRTFCGWERPSTPGAAPEIVCLGRISHYPDALEIGGFWVRPDRRGHGHARRMVAHVLSQLPPALPVYCVPFLHLVPFYTSFGLVQASEAELPAPLRAKWGFCRASYSAGRHAEDVTVLRLPR